MKNEVASYVDKKGLTTSLSGMSLNDILSKINSKDVKNISLTGFFSSQKFDGNFIECKVHDSVFESIDFSRCDWKDCFVESCEFKNCKLSHASDITNSFHNCLFCNCFFEDTGVSHSEFVNCKFVECDFSHVIIKSSYFENVEFSNCKTSNRMIESSLLFDCKFKYMDIEKQLITGNFGMYANSLNKCSLFERALDGGKKYFEWECLKRTDNYQNYNIMEQLRVMYFYSGNLMADIELLEKALNPVNWLPAIRIASSFGALVVDFSRFLLWSYERERIPSIIILHFHTNNFLLLKHIEEKESQLALYQTLAGIHLSLTREVDIFSTVLKALLLRLSAMKTLHFSAEGPLEKEYYHDMLCDVNLTNVNIVEVKPRNSPVELILSIEDPKVLTALVAIFLSSKTKISILKYIDNETVSSDAKSNAPAVVKKIFNFSTGLSKQQNDNFELDMQTLLPYSFMLDINLQIPIKAVFKFGSILKEIRRMANDKSNP